MFAQSRLEDTRATDGLAKEPHPSQISHNWSLLYVWLQYARSYMILSWVMMMLLGDIEGLLPSSARELFRIEELVLVSEKRTKLFFFGQFCPFLLSKVRHGIVAAFSSIAIVRYIVFNVFTSHTEVALLVSSDTIVITMLLQDWAASMAGDFWLRLDLNRLRGGYFRIRSRHEHDD